MSANGKTSISTRRRIWRGTLFVFDALTVNIAYFLALVIRFSDAESFRDPGMKYVRMFLSYAPCYTIASLIIFLVLRLYSGVWRYAGFNDVKKLTLANVCTCLLYVFGSLIIVGRMPVSVYVLGAGFQFVIMCLSRLAPRYIVDGIANMKAGRGDISVPLMIIGVGENTRIIQNKINRDRSNIVKPVCVVDYAYEYQGKLFNGLPVFNGPDAVDKCIGKYDIRCVIFADHDLPREFYDNVVKICEKKNIEVRDFIIGTEYRSRGVKIKELLETLEGPVCLVGLEGEEKRFSDSKDALKAVKENCVVKKVYMSDSALCVVTGDDNAFLSDDGEDWIRKYREETGSEVSFF